MALAGLITLGSINIPANNGVVALFDAFPTLEDLPTSSVNSIFFQAHDANVGKTYIGTRDLSVTGDDGIIAVFPAPSSSFIPGIGIDVGASTNAVPLHQLAVGGATQNDKVRVTVLTT